MQHFSRILLMLTAVLGVVSGFTAAQDAEPATTVSIVGGVMTMPGTLVDVGGHQLHLYCQGEGSPTVVLDAGSGDWSLRLMPLQAHIAEFTRVCVYDRAGHGWSEPGPLPVTAQQAADDLYALLTSDAVEPPFVLAAHSWAGLPARILGSQHPELLAGLVFIDARPAGALALAQAQSPEANAGFAESVAELQGFADLLRDNPLPPALLANFIPAEMVPFELPEAWAATFKRQLASLPFLEASISTLETLAESEAQADGLSLGAVPLIVLVAAAPTPGQSLAGHQSAWIEPQYAQAAASSNSRVVLVEDTGHYIYVEQPQVVVDAIRELVEQARAA